MGSVKSPFPFPLFFPGKIQENVTDSNCNDNDGGDGEIIQVFALIESNNDFSYLVGGMAQKWKCWILLMKGVDILTK